MMAHALPDPGSDRSSLVLAPNESSVRDVARNEVKRHVRPAQPLESSTRLPGRPRPTRSGGRERDTGRYRKWAHPHLFGILEALLSIQRKTPTRWIAAVILRAGSIARLLLNVLRKMALPGTFEFGRLAVC